MKLLATIFTGLFTGAMLFIAVAVVPYWASLDIPQFQAVFKAQAPFIGNFMLTMLNLSIVLTIVACFVNKPRKMLVVAAVSLILILPLYKFLHEPINHKLLSDSPLNALEGARLLAEWKVGHYVRLGLGLVANLALHLGRHA